MAEVQISIGGRDFNVMCQDGEENYIHSLSVMLDKEVRELDQGAARVTESRLLLMAGLKVADKLASLERGDGGKNSLTTAQDQAVKEAVEKAVSDTRAESAGLLGKAEAEVKSLREELATMREGAGADAGAAAEAEAAKDALRDIVGKLEVVVNDE